MSVHGADRSDLKDDRGSTLPLSLTIVLTVRPQGLFDPLRSIQRGMLYLIPRRELERFIEEEAKGPPLPEYVTRPPDEATSSELGPRWRTDESVRTLPHAADEVIIDLAAARRRLRPSHQAERFVNLRQGSFEGDSATRRGEFASVAPPTGSPCGAGSRCAQLPGI
jgi:hypothetical protein